MEKGLFLLLFATFALSVSLDSCWTSTQSRSALLVSHGGAWDLSNPYDSMGAYQRAFAFGSNAVKGDYRVSKVIGANNEMLGLFFFF